MKLADEPATENSARLKGDDAQAAPVPFIQRARSSFGMLVILVCIGVLAEGAHAYLFGKATGKPAWFLPENERPVAAELVERPGIVRPFTDFQTLKKGDHVVLKPTATSAPKVREVLAAPNEAVVTRRAGTLNSLYMVGGSGYVVGSERDAAQIVRLQEIAGTLESSPKE